MIYKEYNTLSDFDVSDFPEVGMMFMVKEKDENNAFPVYRYTGDENELYSYITGLSSGEAIKGEPGEPGKDGEQGIPGQAGKDGITYQPVIGTITSISSTQNATASVSVNEENKTATFNFGIPKGKDGSTPKITENTSNTEDFYRLDITIGDKTFTTPNLMGVIGMEYKNKSVGTPVGEIISYMGTIAPSNYLICDGTEYPITDYPYLAQHFVDNFGSINYFGGNGISTFAVPDLRGEFLRGAGTNTHENQGNGESVGKHQDGTTQTAMAIWANDRLGLVMESDSTGVKLYTNTDKETSKTNVYERRYGNYNITKQSVKSTYRYTSRPTNTSVLYCIKYQPTYWITPTNNIDKE